MDKPLFFRDLNAGIVSFSQSGKLRHKTFFHNMDKPPFFFRDLNAGIVSFSQSDKLRHKTFFHNKNKLPL